MSHENRIYVVDVVYRKPPGLSAAITLCAMNLGEIPYNSDFYNLFKTPIDYAVYLVGEEDPHFDDIYGTGEHIRDVPIREAIEWFSRQTAKPDCSIEERMYFKPCLAMLKGYVDSGEWGNLRVINCDILY